MMLSGATIFSSAVSEHSEQINAVLFKEWQYPIIKRVSCNKCIFAIVQLCGGYLTVSVNKSLLVNSAYAFDSSDIIGVLRPKIAWVMRFDFAVSLLFLAGLFQRYNLCFGQY